MKVRWENVFYEWITKNEGFHEDPHSWKKWEVLCLSWMCRGNTWQYYKTSKKKKYSKAPFDFHMKVGYPRRYIFIDVVGSYQTDRGRRLITCGKVWTDKLNFIKKPDEGWITFILDGIWNFYQIHENMPKNDILLTSGRLKNIKSADYVFRYHEDTKEDLEELLSELLEDTDDPLSEEDLNELKWEIDHYPIRYIDKFFSLIE